jgi:hypothetical protein
MKAVIYRLMVFLLVVFLLITPHASAQDNEENEGDDQGCIFATFCLIMLFIIFLIYLSAKRKSETSQDGRARGRLYTPPQRPGRRYPLPYTAYPPPPSTTYTRKPEPQRKDVKCDLCGSKNLRFFEKGYVKCKDCRHVFYITEGYRRKKRR